MSGDAFGQPDPRYSRGYAETAARSGSEVVCPIVKSFLPQTSRPRASHIGRSEKLEGYPENRISRSRRNHEVVGMYRIATPRPAAAGRVRRRAVDEIDVVHRQLPALELDAGGRADEGARIVHRLVQHDVVVGAGAMPEMHAVAMGAGDDGEASVLPVRVVDGKPGRAGRERTDGPVLSVLVHRHLHAVGARLAEDLTSPHDDVVSDHAGDEIEQGFIQGDVEEGRVALEIGAGPVS